MVIKKGLGKLSACRILKNVKYVYSQKWTCQTIPSVSLVCTGWTLHLHTRNSGIWMKMEDVPIFCFDSCLHSPIKHKWVNYDIPT